MVLQSAKIVATLLRQIEGNLAGRTRRRLFAAGPVSESSYYRYKRGDESPTVETLSRFAQFVDLALTVGVGAYTSASKGGPEVTPRLAEIAAALGELNDEDQERVVRMVQRFAALRSEPSEPPPARASGSRVAKAK